MNFSRKEAEMIADKEQKKIYIEYQLSCHPKPEKPISEVQTLEKMLSSAPSFGRHNFE